MIAVVVVEHHFQRTPDGRVWTQLTLCNQFWQRYLEVFDGVRIVARVRDVAEVPSQYLRADGPGVTVAAVPDYLGPLQYLRISRAVHRAMRHVVGPQDAVILRVPSHLVNCLFPILMQRSHPYAVEVVGDPWDVFSPGAVRHWLRSFFRRLYTSKQKAQCAHACAASYVTEGALQRCYPAAAGVPTCNYSSVELTQEAFKNTPHNDNPAEHPSEKCFLSPEGHPSSKPVRMIYVGTLSQLYKAPDVLLRAAARCVRDGLNLQLTIVGDGQYRSSLEQLASRLGLMNRVVFRGQLTAGKAVRKELDAADLFVLPSRQEGLPRALIEAMARGLPCISSTVGGIPELLPAEDMVRPNDVAALAAKIQEVATDPMRMQRMSSRNLKRAEDYGEAILRPRRTAFYRHVREQTEQWLRHSSALSQPDCDAIITYTIPLTQAGRKSA